MAVSTFCQKFIIKLVLLFNFSRVVFRKLIETTQKFVLEKRTKFYNFVFKISKTLLKTFNFIISVISN